jgi:hypothetical protein
MYTFSMVIWGALRAAIFAFSVAVALAQSGSGTISGTILDNLGAPLPQAEIQAKNAASGAVFKAMSAAKGDYTLSGLPAGAYEFAVIVRAGRRHVENIAVEAGKASRVDVQLRDDNQLGTLGDNFLSAAALDRRPVPTGPAPRALDGKVDLSGVWGPRLTTDPGQPQMLPWAEAVFKERGENNGKYNPTSYCLPWGPVLDGGFPIKFIQAPTVIVILIEDVFSYRQIFLDGRGHPKDGDPAWMGHSIGHWEGDTLVVDTAGFNDKSWSPARRPHTDKLHLIERIRRPDAGHLEIEMTVDDPGTYTKAWTMKMRSNLLVGDEIGEYICAENNQDVEHLVGK